MAGPYERRSAARRPRRERRANAGRAAPSRRPTRPRRWCTAPAGLLARATVLARWPALPVLAERLAPGATVVLDDAERPGEQEVLRRWERDHGVSVERRSASAGVALCRVPGETEAPGHG